MACVSVTVPEIPDCLSMAEDTWKPEITNPESGQPLQFTLRSASPNTHFLILKQNLLTWDKLTEGTTDTDGCFTGEIQPQQDGSYTLKACYDVFGACITDIGTVYVTWGTKPMDLGTMAVIAAGLLGIAYILSNRE